MLQPMCIIKCCTCLFHLPLVSILHAGTLPVTIVPRAEFFSAGNHTLTITFTDIYGQTAVEELDFSVPEPLGR